MPDTPSGVSLCVKDSSGPPSKLRNKDAKQFEKQHKLKPFQRRSMSVCPFCYDNIKDRIVAEHNSVVAIQDNYPVTDGHLLIIPKRHIEDYFSINETEKNDIDVLIMKLKDRITEKDHTVTGFNIGTNIGESAGQTIFHAHIHLIPRRNDDTPHPRGGVRGVIPEKMSYPTPSSLDDD